MKTEERRREEKIYLASVHPSAERVPARVGGRPSETHDTPKRGERGRAGWQTRVLLSRIGNLPVIRATGARSATNARR